MLLLICHVFGLSEIKVFVYPLSVCQLYPAFANSVDPDQMAFSEASWAGSALFVIKYLNL